ncbi:hypothetical protein ABE099_14440 [Paenibacillus turicensis]
MHEHRRLYGKYSIYPHHFQPTSLDSLANIFISNTSDCSIAVNL